MRIAPEGTDRRIARRKEAGERKTNAGCASGVVRCRAAKSLPVQRRSRLSKTRSPPRDGAKLIQPSAHVANHSSWAVNCLSRWLALYLAQAAQPDSPDRAFQRRNSDRGNSRL